MENFVEGIGCRTQSKGHSIIHLCPQMQKLVSTTMKFHSQLAIALLLLLSATVVTAVPAHYELTKQQIADFRRDGVIVVRGLLDGEILRDAVKAAHTVEKRRSWAQRLVHKIFPAYRNLDFQTYRKYKALQKVAFDSTAPTICAKLMGLDEEWNGSTSSSNTSPRSLRLLKEAIFGFGKGDTGCGWHVDDKLFWPCEDSHSDNQTEGTKEQRQKRRSDTGINVWITLSPLTAEEGGGLAVAPRSHNLTGKGRAGNFLQRARKAIASKGPQTQCFLDKVDPSCHQYMERSKRVYDLQPGDAIIHDRYVFHKTEGFNEKSSKSEKEGEEVIKHRISFRYMPSDATFFNNGNGNDGAAFQKKLQTGDPLWKAGEYFPQVWPNRLEDEAKTSPKPDVNLFGSRFLIRTAKALLLAPKPKPAQGE